MTLSTANEDFLPKNFKLLGEYCEGHFVGLVWEHRHTRILGLTMIGELQNEPAFSDQSNSLTQALRLLRHAEGLSPQRLVIDWRLREIQETPETLMVKVVKRLHLRHCSLALIIHKDANPATASKLLRYCELKKSVAQGIECLRQSESLKSGQRLNASPKRARFVAMLICIVAFLFFLGLAAMSLFHHSLSPADRFPAVVVLAFGGAVASGLFTGDARLKGPLQPFAQKSSPLQINVVGSIATFIILLILGKLLFD